MPDDLEAPAPRMKQYRFPASEQLLTVSMSERKVVSSTKYPLLFYYFIDNYAGFWKKWQWGQKKRRCAWTLG
jgi:hypothetical protein